MEIQNMEQLIKEEQRLYAKKWREENPEKAKKQRENYWKKRVEKRLQTEMSTQNNQKQG